MDQEHANESTATLLAEGWQAYEVLQLKEALEIFQTVANKEPDNYEAQLALTKTYIRMRREADATAAAEQCLILRPDRAEAYTALGVILFLDDKLAEANDRLLKAIELAPEDPEPHLTMAQVKSDMHQVTEANDELQASRRLISHIEDEHLRRQLEASELHARTYVLLGQNKVSEAMASAAELTAYEEENPYAACLAYSNLGLMEARAKHYDKSAEYLSRAYTRNPYFFRAGSALGRVLYVKGEATRAAEVLGEVVSRAPEIDAHTRHAYAAALAKSGQRQEARIQYKAALKAGLKGLEALVAFWQTIWLSDVGRMVVIGVVLAGLAAWIIFGKPSPSTLAFVGVLVILVVMQQLLGRRRFH